MTALKLFRRILLVLILLGLGGAAFSVNREISINPPKDNSPKPDDKTYTMAFVGDVMLSRSVARQIAKNQDDYRFPFLKIKSDLDNFNLLIGNLEGPMSDKGTNQGSIYSFRHNPKAVEGLSYAGFDLVSLANNHMLDWGRDALIQTTEILSSSSIASVGAGKNYTDANSPKILQVGSTTIGFLSYTNLYPKSLNATTTKAGISDISVSTTSIKELRSKVDILVVIAHWGDEYKTHSNKTQEDLAHSWIDAGADLVVGHHPHVVQEIENYKGKFIAYSLGNFVFDQGFSVETMQGLMVVAKIKNGKIEDLLSKKIQLSPEYQPFLTSGE